MLKLIAIIHKKPGLTNEEFERYWKEKHGTVAARVIPGLRKYTQNYLVKLPGVNYEGDGIVELWFDDLESFQKYLTWRQPNEGKILLEDEDKFIDRRKIVRYAVEEYCVIK